MARVDCDVLIMGNGIVGNLAAAWFTRHMPALRVNVVGPAARTLPIVGESLVEFSTQLLQEIGLGRHLVEEQLPKYGLTFYYKLDPAVPADPRYVVDAVPTNPPLPSFLVNRFTLDDALQRLNRDNGVEHVDGKAVRVELGSGARHGVTVRGSDGTVRTHTARWVMDATGRRRLLARQLHLGDSVPHPAQRVLVPPGGLRRVHSRSHRRRHERYSPPRRVLCRASLLRTRQLGLADSGAGRTVQADDERRAHLPAGPVSRARDVHTGVPRPGDARAPDPGRPGPEWDEWSTPTCTGTTCTAPGSATPPGGGSWSGMPPIPWIRCTAPVLHWRPWRFSRWGP